MHFFIETLVARIPNGVARNSKKYENPQVFVVFREKTRFRFEAPPDKKNKKNFQNSMPKIIKKHVFSFKNL